MSDYLLDLLNNHKRYTAKINVLKNHQSMFDDPDEFERYMQTERDLVLLDYCLQQLQPEQREVLDQLYYKGYSMKQLGRVKMLSKSGIQNRKRVAIRELRAIFKPQK
jgi:RNA polymerase sigma factor (sigma-70 family)